MCTVVGEGLPSLQNTAKDPPTSVTWTLTPTERVSLFRRPERASIGFNMPTTPPRHPNG